MLTTEYQILLWSVILGLVHVGLTATGAIMVRGMPWGLGPRDVAMPRLEGIPGRLERACFNFLETFPFFAALVLLAGILGVHSSLTTWGAMLYFGARVAYVPVYIAGIPVLRTGIWTVSLVGIVLLLVAVI